MYNHRGDGAIGVFKRRDYCIGKREKERERERKREVDGRNQGQ